MMMDGEMFPQSKAQKVCTCVCVRVRACFLVYLCVCTCVLSCWRGFAPGVPSDLEVNCWSQPAHKKPCKIQRRVRLELDVTARLLEGGLFLDRMTPAL